MHQDLSINFPKIRKYLSRSKVKLKCHQN